MFALVCVYVWNYVATNHHSIFTRTSFKLRMQDMKCVSVMLPTNESLLCQLQ